MIKGTAPMALQLTFDGTSEELMNLAKKFVDEIPELDHDGWDFGEVMGIFIQFMNSRDDISFSTRDESGNLLTLDLVENGLFEWEGLPPI
jgi:hypothetical protein